MPRTGFVKIKGDKDAKGIQGIKSKPSTSLRIRSRPLLAFEDSNGVSPAHSPTRWKVMQGVEQNDYVGSPGKIPSFLPKNEDEQSSAKNLQNALKPIPTPQGDTMRKETKIDSHKRGRQRKSRAKVVDEQQEAGWTTFSDGIAGRPTPDAKKTSHSGPSKGSKTEAWEVEKSVVQSDTFSIDNGSATTESLTSEGRALTQVVSSSSDDSSCMPEHIVEETTETAAESEERRDSEILYEYSIPAPKSADRTTAPGRSTSNYKTKRSGGYNDPIIVHESANATQEDVSIQNASRKINKRGKSRGDRKERSRPTRDEHDDTAQSISSDGAVKTKEEYMDFFLHARKTVKDSNFSAEPVSSGDNDGSQSISEKGMGKSKQDNIPHKKTAEQDFRHTNGSIASESVSAGEKETSSFEGSTKNRTRTRKLESRGNSPAVRAQRTSARDSYSAERPSAKFIREAEDKKAKTAKQEYIFDDAGIWNAVMSPRGDTNNIWTAPDELLSPAQFAKTPMHGTKTPVHDTQQSAFHASSASVADLLAAAESAIEGPSKTNDDSQKDFMKKFLEMALPMIQSGSISEDQQEEIRKAAGRMGVSMDVDWSKPEPFDPTQAEVPIDVAFHRRKTFSEAKKKIGKRESIHFKKVKKGQRRANSPSSHSLLDSAHERDMQLELKQVPSNASDIKSVGSETVSTLSYNTREMYRTFKNPEQRTMQSNQESVFSDSKLDAENRPLGSSSREIYMLNTFLKIAGPTLDGPSLSAEDRELLHDDALKAGLPEDFVNQVLDLSAGIQRWDETTHRSYRSKHRKARTVSPSGSDSLHTKFTECSDNSQATKYTRDTESISCYTYDEDGLTRKTPRTDVDLGGYSCVDRIASYFWLESDHVGQDMIDNVAAVVSGDMDSVYTEDAHSKKSSKHKRQGEKKEKSRRWLT